jgi:deazaflavin-dependent oxidoreductase (nitroreductase family)
LFNQKIASTRLVAWIYARTLQHLDRFTQKITGGRATITGSMAGLPVVILVSTGAKSNLPRTIPLLGIPDEQDENKFALIGSNFGQRHHPSWYFNLKKNPSATCTIRGQSGKYYAREASGEEYDRFWQFAENIYLGFPRYKERVGKRQIPIMVMTPQDN